MALFVQKYGGSSLGSSDHIKHVASSISRAVVNGHRVVAVVSAMTGETERLIELAAGFSASPDPRELAALLSSGELVSSSLVALALRALGVSARSYSAAQLGLRSVGPYLNAQVSSIDRSFLQAAVSSYDVVVVAGFQAVNDQGETTTLGRGGSDLSAVFLAAVLEAEECQIFKDVDGVFTTNPQVVPQAKLLSFLSAKELLALSESGSGVLQTRAVSYAHYTGTALRISSCFSSHSSGTFVSPDFSSSARQQWAIGLSCLENQSKVTIQGIRSEDASWIMRFILSLSHAGISVSALGQSHFSDQVHFFVVVHDHCLPHVLSSIASHQKEDATCVVSTQEQCAIVTVVGSDIISHVQAHDLILSSLLHHSLSTEVLSITETQLRLWVSQTHTQQVISLLHDILGLSCANVKEKVCS